MKIKNLLLVTLLSAAALALPSCFQFPKWSEPSFNSDKLGGNGGGYEGIYMRFLPGFSCEGTPASKEFVTVKNGKLFLYENKTDRCDVSGRKLSEQEIGRSPLESDFITVHDWLFKYYPTQPSGVPDSLAEVLCRDNYENPSFEIVAHYDREKNEALTRVYFAAGAGQTESDFSVSRLLSVDNVKYVSQKLSFGVDLPAAALASQQGRRFAGKINASSIPGLAPSQPLTCVIGGSLDTSNWKINEAGAQLWLNTFFIYDDEAVFPVKYPGYDGPTLWMLSKWGKDGSISNYTRAITGGDFAMHGRIETNDPSVMVFQARSESWAFDTYWAHDTVTRKSLQLTSFAGVTPYYISMRTFPQVSSNRSIVFMESRDTSGADVIRWGNLNTGEIKTVLSGTYAGFKVLPKSNLAIIVTQDQVKLLDLVTGSLTDFPNRLGDSCRIYPYFDSAGADEKNLLVSYSCDGGTTVSQALISIADGTISMGISGIRYWTSPDGRWMITVKSRRVDWTDPLTGETRQITQFYDPLLNDLLTKQTRSVAIDSQFSLRMQSDVPAQIDQSAPQAAWNGSKLYSFFGDVDSPSLQRLDLVTSERETLCDGAIGKKMSVGLLPDGRAFLFTYDAVAKVYRFYHAKSPTECPRLNEFPNINPFLTGLAAIKEGFIVSLAEPDPRFIRSVPSNDIKDILFIPADGRPPLKLNALDTKPWHFAVSLGRRKIFFVGPVNDSYSKLYSFDLDYN